MLGWLRDSLCGKAKAMTVEERRLDRRSRVRVWVTYWAAFYIFVGSAVLIALILTGDLKDDNFDNVRELFTLVLPIATGVVTYWFATRSQGRAGETSQIGSNENEVVTTESQATEEPQTPSDSGSSPSSSPSSVPPYSTNQ